MAPELSPGDRNLVKALPVVVGNPAEYFIGRHRTDIACLQKNDGLTQVIERPIWHEYSW